MANSSATDLECGGGDDEDVNIKEVNDDDDKDCRICHLSIVNDGIVLGCCCKDDLAAAHKHCAETWFKIKGNKYVTC